MRAVIPWALSVLSNADQKFQPNAETGKVWDAILDPFTDDAIRVAVQAVACRKHFGVPTLGDVVEEIQGHIEWRSETRMTNDGEVYKTGREVKMRVFPDGFAEPAAETVLEELDRLRDAAFDRLPECEDEYVGYHGEAGREALKRAPIEKKLRRFAPEYARVAERFEKLRFRPHLVMRASALAALPEAPGAME